MRRFNALDLVIEFKYLSLKDLNLTGEQLKAKNAGRTRSPALRGSQAGRGDGSSAALRSDATTALWLEHGASLCRGWPRFGAGGVSAGGIKRLTRSLTAGWSGSDAPPWS